MAKRSGSLLPGVISLGPEVSGEGGGERDKAVVNELSARALLEVDRAGVAAEVAAAAEESVESLDLDRLLMAVRAVVARGEDEEGVLQFLSNRLRECAIPAVKDNALEQILRLMESGGVPLNVLAILADSEDEDLALLVFAAPNFPMDKLKNLDESQFLPLAQTVFLLPNLSVELGRYLFKRLGVTNCLAFMLKQMADEPDAIPMNFKVWELFLEHDWEHGKSKYQLENGFRMGGGLTPAQLMTVEEYAVFWGLDVGLHLREYFIERQLADFGNLTEE